MRRGRPLRPGSAQHTPASTGSALPGQGPATALETGGPGAPFRKLHSWFWNPPPSHRNRALWPVLGGKSWAAGRGGGFRASPGRGKKINLGGGPASRSPSLSGLICDGAWRAAVYGVSQSRTRLKRLSSSSPFTVETWHPAHLATGPCDWCVHD